MQSDASREIKAKLPVELQKQTQTTIDFMPYLTKGEETIVWGMVMLAYVTGRAEATKEALARHNRTSQAIIAMSTEKDSQ
jgi:hypothetical protein